ncbi:MAG: aspartate aminotransferase family protein [Methyloligellaceae bacterium]
MSGHVFPRHMKAKLPIAVAAEGCYIMDAGGKQYLDGSGGAAVSCLGHSDQSVKDAIKKQLEEMAYAHTSYFTSKSAEQLADLLVELAPENIDSVYFVSGGSEAVETALKLARQYYVEKGEVSRSRIIARKQSYHGNTLGALAAGGNEWRRQQYRPLLIETSHISPCYAYRYQSVEETAEQYGLRCANELEAEILRLGPEQVMAFIAEPVVGSTLGAVPAVSGYFKRVREICDNYGVLLILDEIMCGMGRTGSLYACEQEGVSPDIITIAKGVGGGYQPLGAALCSREIYQTIEQGSGMFQHGHTYIGHATACAAGVSVISAITERGLVQRVVEQGEKLRSLLLERFSDKPHVGDIRGRGLFQGIEFVKDRVTKEPFSPDNQLNKKIKANAFEQGLMCFAMGGTIDGRLGDHILLAPPFIIEDSQLEELVTKLESAVSMSIDTIG